MDDDSDADAGRKGGAAPDANHEEDKKSHQTKKNAADGRAVRVCPRRTRAQQLPRAGRADSET